MLQGAARGRSERHEGPAAHMAASKVNVEWCCTNLGTNVATRCGVGALDVCGERGAGACRESQRCVRHRARVCLSMCLCGATLLFWGSVEDGVCAACVRQLVCASDPMTHRSQSAVVTHAGLQAAPSWLQANNATHCAVATCSPDTKSRVAWVLSKRSHFTHHTAEAVLYSVENSHTHQSMHQSLAGRTGMEERRNHVDGYYH